MRVCDLSDPLPRGLKQFSHLSLLSNWDHNLMPLHLANVFVEMGFRHAAQACPDPLGSSNPPT